MGWGTIIAAALKILISIMSYLMKRAEIKIDAKKSFYEFVEKMNYNDMAPVKAYEDAKYQLDKLNGQETQKEK